MEGNSADKAAFLSCKIGLSITHIALGQDYILIVLVEAPATCLNCQVIDFKPGLFNCGKEENCRKTGHFYFMPPLR